ncbi:hypothetical protein [Streptomyces sp. NPDC050145]|uniref:hypothetical protein n=1 Tax=Streptomyces sp. NPDC050145 TaxID=3365602 RepID=UPI0037993D9F
MPTTTDTPALPNLTPSQSAQISRTTTDMPQRLHDYLDRLYRALSTTGAGIPPRRPE